jgi:hypothetical protein
MIRTNSTKEGWTKIKGGHYRHDTSKVEIKRNCNTARWEVCGGAECGHSYGSMWVAMYYSEKTPAKFVA